MMAINRAAKRNGNGNGNGGGQKKNENGNGNGNGKRPKFVVGETVRVWKLTGVRDLKMGASTSERPGGDYADITPDEPLTVIETHGARAVCQRPDGQEVWVHINHIWKGSKYYQSKGRQTGGREQGRGQQAQGSQRRSAAQPSPQGTVKQKLERARAAYETALSELESASEDLPMVLDEDEEAAG
jgi:hypothetical protein